MKSRSLPRLAAALFLVLAPTVTAQVPGSRGTDPVPDVPTPGERSAAGMEIGKLIAIINPVGKSNVRGSVVFETTATGVRVTAKIGGLSPNSTHAFHIHEFGDLGSEDATSAGGHFNPEGHAHAMPDQPQRHAGDLGNLQADADGNATQVITVQNVTLGSGKNGILGRAVIVHEKQDDGGQPSGNAGSRIGAGVIGISKDAQPGLNAVPPVPGTDPSAAPH